MAFVPEWAPSVHPMVVHFPIVLLFLAVLADLIAVVLGRQLWLRQAAAAVYALGAIAAAAAFYTGRAAADGVLLPAAANPVLTDHADWALWTVWFYGIYAAVRLFAAWKGLDRATGLHAGLLVIGAAGLFLVYATGDHGAEMVYRYGVGVAAASQKDLQAHDHSSHEGADPDRPGAEHAHTGEEETHDTSAGHAHGGQADHRETAEPGHGQADEAEGHHEEADSGYGHAEEAGVQDEDTSSVHEHGDVEDHLEAMEPEHSHGGGESDHRQAVETASGHVGGHRDGGSQVGETWKWTADHDGARTFDERFQPVAGTPDTAETRVAQDPVHGDVLALRTSGTRLVLTGGPSIGSVQIDAVLNREAFEGRVSLLHHVSNSEEFGFLTLDGGSAIRLGEATRAETEVQDEGSAKTDRWITVRVVADRTHFRGYVDGKIVVHGHGPERSPGPAGLLLKGSGSVLLKSFQVTRLR